MGERTNGSPGIPISAGPVTHIYGLKIIIPNSGIMGRLTSNRERRRSTATNSSPRHNTTIITNGNQNGSGSGTGIGSFQDTRTVTENSNGVDLNTQGVFPPSAPRSQTKADFDVPLSFPSISDNGSIVGPHRTPKDRRKTQSLNEDQPYSHYHTPRSKNLSSLSATSVTPSSVSPHRKPRTRRTSCPYPKSRVKPPKRLKLSVDDAMDLDELVSSRDLDVQMKSDSELRPSGARNYMHRAPVGSALEDVDMEELTGTRHHHHQVAVPRDSELEMLLRGVLEETHSLQSHVQGLLRFVQLRGSSTTHMSQANLKVGGLVNRNVNVSRN
ncbi:hypothetical protein E1B28_002279 [Marasmius oreades]|uniref:Uncharacterized protein n=1 Tax=Marasmius oreades TaxID=181124 RepID=A0A9P7ULE3_9AGAR|nr:uncharacterized protein E1B28_002279 [Marasmius oreades]KAG7086315.1 hypothetical protein E1B28_002279 [Marasmius oreades]